jgi:hypothetical protein
MGTSRPHSGIMKPDHLKQLIASKQAWTEPLAPEEIEQGFKGWYASKQLPHFDAPGTRQFITYRLADAMPAARRGEWKAFLALEDDEEKQRKIEAYLDKGYGACHLRDRALRTWCRKISGITMA